MKVSVRSDVGLVRQTNQDAYRVATFGSPEWTGGVVYLLGVADGMGGYQAGEVASHLALDTVVECIGRAYDTGEPLEEALTEAMATANRRVVKRGLEDPECAGMGTTVTVAIVSGALLHIGHVGDSRAYILRDGRLEQVTRDHSLVAELVRNGDLTEEQAQTHPQRNILTQAFGSDLRVKADVSRVPLKTGDYILLCTDGLTGPVPAADIEKVLAESRDLDEASTRLVALANERGGYDNITVLLAGPVTVGGVSR
ncbi:MAG: Stp1/IreP family PP2C-type Ser/Thr phosphatase [Firmicutes bacterium]|nr:Stp1/IreP family PP2C-type Ser/Thr phosphatase [Bacillota bacterium]